jgi:hypothetical protein
MLDFGESVPPSHRNETSAHAGSINKLFTSVEANDYGVDAVSARCITSDHEFLGKIDAMLSP